MPMFQNITQSVKKNPSFNDFEQRRMALYCSKETISISYWNNVKTQWCIRLEQKQT